MFPTNQPQFLPFSSPPHFINNVRPFVFSGSAQDLRPVPVQPDRGGALPDGQPELRAAHHGQPGMRKRESVSQFEVRIKRGIIEEEKAGGRDVRRDEVEGG